LLFRLWTPSFSTVEILSESSPPPLADAAPYVDEQSHFDSKVANSGPLGRRALRRNARVLLRNHSLGHRDILLSTNALGFRDRPLTEKTVPRVLFLGDSITMADYLHEEETFVRRVEALASEYGTRIETINAGVGAASIGDELALWQETGAVVRPDVVVLCFYLNDFQRSPAMVVRPIPIWLRISRIGVYLWSSWRSEAAGSAPFPSAAEINVWRQRLSNKMEKEAGAQGREIDPFEQQVLDRFDDWGGAWSDDVWQEVLAPALTRAQDLARMQRAQLVVAVMPVSFQVEAVHPDDRPQQRAAALAHSLGIPFLDLLPPLRSAHQAEPESALFYDHCHHTPRGADVVARAVAPFVIPILRELR